MKDLKKFKKLYEATKLRASKLMSNGQITQYLATLQEMNQYKQKMLLAIAN